MEIINIVDSKISVVKIITLFLYLQPPFSSLQSGSYAHSIIGRKEVTNGFEQRFILNLERYTMTRYK